MKTKGTNKENLETGASTTEQLNKVSTYTWGF